MLDFKALSQFKSQTSQLQSDRRSVSDSSLAKGYDCLGQAEASQYKDKHLIVEAFEHFSAAIRYQRTSAEAYNAAGYIFLLLGEWEEAREYFLEAHDLDPANADAQSFLMAISQQQKAGPSEIAFSVLLPDNAEIIDYDALYDQTETMILTYFRHYMEKPQPQPTLVDEDYIQLQKNYQSLQEVCYRIQKQIDVVQNEIETGPLETKFKPLEIRLKQYANALEKADLFRALEQNIFAQIKQLTVYEKSLSSSSQPDIPIDVFLEGAYEACDQYADQLDSLESQGYSIQELERIYTILLEQVQTLQDIEDSMPD